MGRAGRVLSTSRSPLDSQEGKRFMSAVFLLDERTLELAEVTSFAMDRLKYGRIEISDGIRARVRTAHQQLYALIEKGTPIYGVTTGFGDSCHRVVGPSKAEELQRNLVAYLSCGTG